MDDTIRRQAAIDELSVDAELLRRVLDDTDVVGAEREKYGWGLGLIESCISDMEELPSAQPEPQWIPCNERLPEAEKKRYWVCTDTEYQCECRWTNNPPFFYLEMGEFDEWGWSIFDIPQHSHVVAWMPLPEPYKEEDDAVD